MRTVVITGGIGGGKSSVCRLLRDRGVPVYNCDSAARRLYREDASLVPALEESLGTALRDNEGRFSPAALASVIFPDPGALAKTEAIVHPAVLGDFVSWRDGQTAPWTVMESAIVLEKPLFNGVYDTAVLVDAPSWLRLQRACGRDSAAPDEVLARMKAQHFDLKRIDAVILNDAGVDVLERRTRTAFSFLGLDI